MTIRRFQEADAEQVSSMVIRTLRRSNAKDYPPAMLEGVIARQTPDFMRRRGAGTHFYVAEEAGRIIGCGAIGPYWDVPEEYSLFTLFVDPDRQGTGVGHRLMQTLEADEYFLRAKRVEIPASITALGFYRKLGYRFKDGAAQPDEDLLYRLEKRPGECSPPDGGAVVSFR